MQIITLFNLKNLNSDSPTLNNTWQDSNYLNPKFEFSGPEVSLENLIIDAELFKPDWIANEKIKRINSRQSYPKQRIEEINNSIQLYRTDHKIT